jgi:hypothetical protein
MHHQRPANKEAAQTGRLSEGSEALTLLRLGLPDGFLPLQICLTTTTLLNLVGLSSHNSLYIRRLIRLCSATMDSVAGRFNLYLAFTVAAVLLCGCQTNKSKKPEASIFIHAEATDDTSFTRTIKLFREGTVTMKIHQTPMLTERNLVEAKVENVVGGGFAISLKFSPGGQWTLDQYTSLNIGRHYAIFVMFGKDPIITRWIAAPIIDRRISDGMILFTPDCTREEADEIVAGLIEAEGLNSSGGDAGGEEKK